MGTLKKIYILHGWTYSIDGTDPLSKWKPFVNELISIGLKPIFPRIPGITKNINQVWSLEKYIEWLKKIVDEEKEKVILVGHSNGGRIAFSFAERYPEKVTHLILIDSAGIRHNKLPHRIKKFIFRSIAKLGKKLTSSEKFRLWLYKLAREGDYRKASPAQRQTMLNLINTDFTITLKKVKIPTLIIWGGNDNITPLPDGLLIHKLIKGSQLKVIEEGRHSPQFTHPKEVVKEINEYL